MNINDYTCFMCNPNNIECCDECPENKNFNRHFPCGQQNCWVQIHCDLNEENEEN